MNAEADVWFVAGNAVLLAAAVGSAILIIWWASYGALALIDRLRRRARR